ncbi:MAG TPA: hypothetical protein VMG08_15620 [Allosphingosinicella sp.]|nr:hypothetical protein [Allosphingosinicella sp.]
MRSILSKATTGAMIAGAALLVAACGGGAANNTANAVSNEPVVVNEPMAPDVNGMPPVDANAPMTTDMNAPAPAMNSTNTTNAM